MTHTIYFNPEVDTVHVIDDSGRKFRDLLLADTETIRSIKTLAVGSHLSHDNSRQHTTTYLRPFKSLQTLILVVEGEADMNEQELIRKHMEDELAKLRNRLIRQKLPLVKVMDAQTLESLLCL